MTNAQIVGAQVSKAHPYNIFNAPPLTPTSIPPATILAVLAKDDFVIFSAFFFYTNIRSEMRKH